MGHGVRSLIRDSRIDPRRDIGVAARAGTAPAESPAAMLTG